MLWVMLFIEVGSSRLAKTAYTISGENAKFYSCLNFDLNRNQSY